MSLHTIPIRLYSTVAACALVTLSMAACSGLNRENDRYLEAETGNPLSVPPDLTGVGPGQDEQVASAASAGASTEERDEFARFQRLQDFEEYERYQRWREQLGEPEELSYEAFLADREQASREEEEQEREGVVLLRSESGERRLHVFDAFDDTWDRVGEALRLMGLEIVRTSRDARSYTVVLPGEENAGSILTFWRRARAEGDITLTEGDRGTYVSIIGMGDDIDTDRQADDLLSRLANQLRVTAVAEPGPAPAAAAAAGQTDAPRDARLAVDASGFQHLEIDAPIDRAWDRIADTLDEAGFTVENRDRQRSAFRIRYIPGPAVQDEGGVLRRLAFWRDEEEPVETRYRIQLEGNGEVTVVRVFDQQSRQDATGDRILRILHDQLI